MWLTLLPCQENHNPKVGYIGYGIQMKLISTMMRKCHSCNNVIVKMSAIKHDLSVKMKLATAFNSLWS